jgi:hypothetical protein
MTKPTAPAAPRIVSFAVIALCMAVLVGLVTAGYNPVELGVDGIRFIWALLGGLAHHVTALA